MALLVVSALVDRYGTRALSVAGWAFITGIVLFSGSLYLLVLGDVRLLGPLTPLGGVSFVAGWLALAVAARRSRGTG